MPDTFNKVYRYVKGIYEMKAFATTGSRDLLYYDNKITDANIATSLNMGELTGGVGNATLIMLPDTAKINVTLTAQDVDLRSRQLQTGGILANNGIVDVCEIITASSATLTVTNTPVAPYGSDSVCCYINGDGAAYEFVAGSSDVAGFTATPGETYSVRYYIRVVNAQELSIDTLFNPAVVSLEIKMPVYATTTGASSGALCGYWFLYIPRYQFNGDASLNVNQTTAGTSGLSGQALAYDANDANACTLANLSKLAYMVYQPVDASEGIDGLFVVGGAISGTAGETALTPVKVLMDDGSIAQPDYSALTFSIPSADSAIATVDASGVISFVGAGDTEVTISVTGSSPEISCVANVSVTSA